MQDQILIININSASEYENSTIDNHLQADNNSMSIDNSVSSYDSDESDNAYDSDKSDDSDGSDEDKAPERSPPSQIPRETNQEADTSEFNDNSTQLGDEVVRLKFFLIKQLKFKHFVNAIEYNRAEQDND